MILKQTTIGYKDDVIVLEKLDESNYVVRNGCVVQEVEHSYVNALYEYGQTCSKYKAKRTRKLNRLRKFLKDNKVNFHNALEVLEKDFHLSTETAYQIISDCRG